MRGQAQLEAMRRRGFVPETVDLCLFKTRSAEDWPRLHPRYAVLEAVQSVRPAELRCLVGLEVQIHGEKREVVHAMRDACIAAGARRVIATVFDGRDSVPDYERFRAVEASDTQGVLTWPN
jgi:hypothetical protein